VIFAFFPTLALTRFALRRSGFLDLVPTERDAVSYIQKFRRLVPQLAPVLLITRLLNLLMVGNARTVKPMLRHPYHFLLAFPIVHNKILQLMQH
jgi:hypothetical protein